MEPNATIAKNLFADGAIKILVGHPTIQNLEVVDNFTSPCGAGISVQHQGFNQIVLIENCVFLRTERR